MNVLWVHAVALTKKQSRQCCLIFFHKLLNCQISQSMVSFIQVIIPRRICWSKFHSESQLASEFIQLDIWKLTSIIHKESTWRTSLLIFYNLDNCLMYVSRDISFVHEGTFTGLVNPIVAFWGHIWPEVTLHGMYCIIM